MAGNPRADSNFKICFQWHVPTFCRNSLLSALLHEGNGRISLQNQSFLREAIALVRMIPCAQYTLDRSHQNDMLLYVCHWRRILVREPHKNN